MTAPSPMQRLKVARANVAHFETRLRLLSVGSNGGDKWARATKARIKSMLAESLAEMDRAIERACE